MLRKTFLRRKLNVMRLRNIPGADAAVAACPYVIDEPTALRGKWNTQFEKNQPIHIEVGMGKGQFIFGMAEAHPDINYLGIEKYTSVLLRAVQKIDENPMDSLRFLCFNAEAIDEIFASGEVDRIYLNFSDPWPKDRHAKRRLTSAGFLAIYNEILTSDGFIQFKTDNRDLFDFSVETVEESALWNINEITYDLHHSEFLESNIMTEYEEKFSAQGYRIYRVEARKRIEKNMLK